jgi:hypothetical protein
MNARYEQLLELMCEGDETAAASLWFEFGVLFSLPEEEAA